MTEIATGGEAIRQLLQKVDPQTRIAKIRAEINDAKGEKRSKLHRELKYLEALDSAGLKPDDAYMLTKVPVLPPMYRPLYPDERGQLVVSSVNELLRDLGSVNEQLKDSKDLPDEQRQELERDLYDATSAVFGLSNPISWKRDAKGVFQQIAGSGSPKSGFFQSKVMSRRQNLSGRSTITVEPSPGIDEIGVPEEMAWSIYEPFAVKQLVSAGHPVTEARDEVKKRTTVAKNALQAAMSERPVLVNRAPSLHKFSIMGFQPRLVAGRDIKLNALTLAGFNADFDGDQMAVHVPLSEGARKEAFGMLPSRHLHKPGTEGLMTMPGQAAVLGLYLMTNPKGKTRGEYASISAAIEAMEEGKIRQEDAIVVAGKKTSVGRAMIEQVLPKGTGFGTLDRKGLESMLSDVAEKQPKDFNRVVESLREMGDSYATERGFSIGLDDLEPLARDRHILLAQAERQLRAKGGNEKERAGNMERSLGGVGKRLEEILREKHSNNPMMQMVLAGSRGSIGQVRQILGAPLQVTDAKDRPVPIPIRHSYSEGLDPQEYWAAAYGVRKGMVGRSQQTALPGALAKELLASVVDSVVTEGDPPEGAEPVELSLDRPNDVVDRFLADTVRDKAGAVLAHKNELLTSDKLSRLRKARVKSVKLHTPLNSEMAGGGISALSFGLNERGQLPEIGDNIGLLAGQAITEPLSQMTLKAFHHGGLAGAGSNVPEGFDRIKQLLELPENVVGKATLANRAGLIKAVREAPAGGWHVDIDDEPHYVAAGRALAVKAGDSVKPGDRLSDGVQKPQEILQLRGLRPMQDYLVEELQANMPGVRRRYLEAVVGSMTNLVRVDDSDDEDELVPGDVVPNWMARGHKGRFAPVMKGVSMLPLIKANGSWLAGMDYRRLKDVLREGTLRGDEAKIHTFNPLPAYAYGAEFGLGEGGRY